MFSIALGLRLLTAASITLAFAFVAGYLVFALLVLAASPAQARVLGQRRGESELAAKLEAIAARTACDRIQLPQFSSGCPMVVAFGDKLLAVLSDGRVYRVPRESTVFDSPINQPARAAAPASSPQ